MLISLALAGLVASAALATVSVQVYRADAQTPLRWADPNLPDVYQDIMVGTHLTFFVVSDEDAPNWSGSLWISTDDWTRGNLIGRGYNEQRFNFDDSALPAAGDDPTVLDSLSESGMQFDLAAYNAVAGEWFVLDYYATAVGDCNVGLSAYVDPGVHLAPDEYPDEPPPGGQVWVQGLSFYHVLSRDFDDDTRVDFHDFAVWAERWQETAEPDPNSPVIGDLDTDYAVDVADLALFCDYWLERTDVVEPDTEPNVPDIAL
jgi:hypothetical protein